MSMLTLYFLVKLDSLVGFFGWMLFFIVLILIFFSIFALMYHISEDQTCRDDKKEIRIKKIALLSRMKKIGILFIIVLFLFKAIPTTKEVAFIYIVGTMSQSESSKRIGEEAVKIPEKALQILNYQLDEYMKGFNPNTPK
jgi:Na+/melibiose symporter-like transporter